MNNKMKQQTRYWMLAALVAASCNKDAAGTGLGVPTTVPPAGSTAVEVERQAAPSSAFAWRPARSSADAAPEEYPARLLRSPGAAAVVVPPLPARVLEIVVKPGDTIAKGAPVARVVMPEADGAAAVLQGADRALAVLTQRRAQLASLEGEGLVRAADVAALDLDIARQQADKLKARAVLAGSGVGGGGPIVLRSPIAGVVTEVTAMLGEYRRPEDGPLATVRGRTGQRVEATFPTMPDPHATYGFRTTTGLAPLQLVTSIPAPTGTGFLTWFDAAADTELPSAAQGRVVVQAPKSADLWVVPATAVGRTAAIAFVVLRAREGAAATKLTVELVRIANADALVRGTIPVGALIASDAVAAAELLTERAP
jgi:membrane fusion protein, heavy metal efflux system